ncbi:MAG: glycoside hydrolase family 16 protein [Rubricoccaceae bacterium]|nr:glycoside hydrolase family 16 protein [Rubricoccaceae bacterium]
MPASRTLRLATVLLVAGLGCDNSVDVTIPDPEATPDGWALVWSDEFDGTALDTTKWDIQLGDGCAEGICGWGNGEFQNYQAENVSVGGGTLTITARQTLEDVDDDGVVDSTYTSARIRTLGKGDWTYGRFEVKAKLPTGQGLWPAIWLLFSEPTYGEWAASGEIDIMEAVGSEPGEVFGTLHYGDTFPGNVFSGEEFQLAAGTFADDFFVFIVEWEEGEIRWYINNVLYQTQTSEDWFVEGVDNPNAPFDHAFHMILNVAVGGNLPGAPDATTVFPQAMEVDYVRVYEREG